MIAMALFLCAAPVLAEDGWQDLFNGKNLDGWEVKNGQARFEAVDGMIVGTSVPKEPNSFLCTKEEFGDFVLEFEFFGHPNLNSGVMIRGLSNKDYRDYRVHGYQCELEDEAQERDWTAGIYDEARRGWLFPDKKDEAWCRRFGEAGKRLYKNGEWNRIRVECKGDSIKTWLNGEPRADLKDDMTAKGFIGLQVHGVGDKSEPMSVKWRNIRLKKL
jgi:hypothetical protein